MRHHAQKQLRALNLTVANKKWEFCYLESHYPGSGKLHAKVLCQEWHVLSSSVGPRDICSKSKVQKVVGYLSSSLVI